MDATVRKTAEDRLFILEELRRRQADDPLRQFTPMVKQKPFIDSVLSGAKKENWFVAANRCLPLTTQVLMADGKWQPLYALRVGDLVLAADPFTRYTRETPVRICYRAGDLPVYKITFMDGRSLVCTENHSLPGIRCAGDVQGVVVRPLSAYMNRQWESEEASSRLLSIDPERPWAIIQSIEPAGSTEVGCIEVEDESHCFVIEGRIISGNSGKSDAGAFIGSTLARFGRQDARYVGSSKSKVEVRDRSTSGWVVSLDFPSSRDTIQPKYFDNGFVARGQSHAPFIPDREVAEWRPDDQVLKLKCGSLIGFKSAESRQKKFQGAEKDWVHFDEEPPKSVYEETTIRVGARPLILYGTCTLLPPEGMVGGVSWLYGDIIKPCLGGERPDVGLFTSSIYDNIHLPVSELQRLESIYAEGSISRRIRLNGELLPGLSGARAYPSFDARVHIRELPAINPRLPLCWTMDFNVEPLCSLIGQRTPGGLFRVHKELVLDEGSVPELCDLFRQTVPFHQAEVWIYGDSTSKNRSRQTGKSDYTLVLNEMRQARMSIRLKVPESNPAVPDRINATNNAMRGFGGETNLEIDPACTELIADLEQVLRDRHGGIKKTYDRKDPYFRRTHTSDALGYWIAYESPVRAADLRPIGAAATGTKLKVTYGRHR